MSDLGRKDFSTQAKEKITPDSSKSTLDKAGEGITNTADKVAGAVQGDASKSNTQSAFDKTRREKDNAVHGGTGESIADKVKNAVGLGGN
ncbi:putative chaperone/heat shock protein Hsp12 [Peziza echinospora]|nr:putative chaperone/heat shock protein Hsp12 [Peziza echinospora]